jgi:peptidoglycan/LPS O-acetylase OafA/YrhL
MRALAVGLVVVYHLWPQYLPGGFIGVDVFFVISGYLITAHLRREIDERGTVSLPRFYARRARRLLPASLTVIAATVIAVIALMPVTRWQSTLLESVASAFYLENWALVAREADYLAAESALSPFQHFWSLSVEEQFYLFWPLLLLIGAAIAVRLRRDRARSILAVIALVVLASVLYAQYVTAADVGLAYFSTFARAFEFGAGALLAFIPPTLRIPARVAGVGSWLALGATATLAFVLDGGTPFPGVAAIAVVVAAAVLLLAGRPDVPWGPGWLMERRVVQWLGDVSYSVYLWHWPLIVLVPFAIDAPLSAASKVIILVATLVLAVLSRTFIEEPVRRMPALASARPRRTLVISAIAMVVVGALAGGGILGGRQVVAQQIEAGGVLDPSPFVASDDIPRKQDCWSVQTSDELTVCSYGDEDASLRVALVGDSHAEAISEVFIEWAESSGWHLDTYLRQACSWGEGPMLKPGGDFARNCTAYRASLASEVLAQHYDVIVTTAAVYRVEPGDSAQGFRDAWAPVLADGTALYVLVDNPRWPDNPVDCLVAHLGEPTTCDIPRAEALPFSDPLVDAAQDLPGVALVDLTDQYCDAETCFASRDGFTVLRDNDHLTATFARHISPVLRDRFTAAGFPGSPE